MSSSRIFLLRSLTIDSSQMHSSLFAKLYNVMRRDEKFNSISFRFVSFKCGVRRRDGDEMENVRFDKMAFR